MDTASVPGSVVAGRFRLLTRLPSVGWAHRWDARDVVTGRDVVLTLVHSDTIRTRDTSADAMRRFREFARSEPGVVRVLDPASTTPFVASVGEPGVANAFDPTTDIGTSAPAPAPRRTAAFVGGAATLVAVLGFGGWFVSTALFGGDYGDVKNVVAVPTLAVPTVPVAPPSGPILPDGAQVWSAVRAPDNADDAGLAVDADPNTFWSTDGYRAPFGDPGNGIGVLVSFAKAVDLSAVWVATPQPGAVVEIRTPPEGDGTLASTRVLGSDVLRVGVNDIGVDAPPGLRQVLVWIAELAPTGTQFEADIAEIGFSGH